MYKRKTLMFRGYTRSDTNRRRMLSLYTLFIIDSVCTHNNQIIKNKENNNWAMIFMLQHMLNIDAKIARVYKSWIIVDLRIASYEIVNWQWILSFLCGACLSHCQKSVTFHLNESHLKKIVLLFFIFFYNFLHLQYLQVSLFYPYLDNFIYTAGFFCTVLVLVYGIITQFYSNFIFLLKCSHYHIYTVKS